MVDRTGSDIERQQRDLRPRDISRSEDQVKRTVEVFQSFVNPFHLDISHPLTSLSSGSAMQEEVRHGVLNALKNGKAQKEVFIRDRLITKTVPFVYPIKGNKFKTLASSAPEKTLSHRIRR